MWCVLVSTSNCILYSSLQFQTHQNQNGYARRYNVYDILWISKTNQPTSWANHNYWMYIPNVSLSKRLFCAVIFNDIPYTAYALKHVSLNQANQTIFVHLRKKTKCLSNKNQHYEHYFHYTFSWTNWCCNHKIVLLEFTHISNIPEFYD